MKKAEAEKAIRSLSSKWFQTLSETEQDHPSLGSFKSWLRANGYGHYLEFGRPKVQMVRQNGGSIRN